MVRVYLFTYAEDANPALACVRCLRNTLPEAWITVVDDASAPCSSNFIRQCFQLGVSSYVQSTFPRNGNLKGDICIKGILSTLVQNSNEDDVIIKIDSDTLLLSPAPIERMRNLGADGFGASSLFRPFAGLCYGFTQKALKLLHEKIYLLPSSSTIEEDLWIGKLIFLQKLNMVIDRPWTPVHTQGRWTAYNWPYSPVLELYRSLDVVTFGTFEGIPSVDKNHVANKMNALIDLVYGPGNNTCKAS